MTNTKEYLVDEDSQLVASSSSSGLNQTIPSDNIMGSGDGFAQLALMWGAQLLACSGKLLHVHNGFRGL